YHSQPRGSFIHVSATSSTFAPAGNVTGAGSNHNSNASFALCIASSSVSPAEAHPGNSGKNAAQRLVSGSRSTTKRSFMPGRVTRSDRTSKQNRPRAGLERRKRSRRHGGQKSQIRGQTPTSRLRRAGATGEQEAENARGRTFS